MSTHEGEISSIRIIGLDISVIISVETRKCTTESLNLFNLPGVGIPVILNQNIKNKMIFPYVHGRAHTF